MREVDFDQLCGSIVSEKLAMLIRKDVKDNGIISVQRIAKQLGITRAALYLQKDAMVFRLLAEAERDLIALTEGLLVVDLKKHAKNAESLWLMAEALKKAANMRKGDFGVVVASQTSKIQTAKELKDAIREHGLPFVLADHDVDPKLVLMAMNDGSVVVKGGSVHYVLKPGSLLNNLYLYSLGPLKNIKAIYDHLFVHCPNKLIEERILNLKVLMSYISLHSHNLKDYSFVCIDKAKWDTKRVATGLVGGEAEIERLERFAIDQLKQNGGQMSETELHSSALQSGACDEKTNPFLFSSIIRIGGTVKKKHKGMLTL